ncbi:MAG: SpoIIE family protein phosphatase [Candidatus Riflebacteria bacterium]|nr:SpoIIE family protein phosphatase [Candidatus Riflebacteria bacterium]
MTQKESNFTAPNLAHYDINVLLVDDQPIVAETVRRMLVPEKDIIFHYCQNPADAMKMATEISPTIILQDLVMPDIDGLTLVKFYRKHPQLKDIPLIVLSSKEEATTKAEAFALGANDYLVKLPDKIELIARIRYHSKGYIALLERNDAYQALKKSQEILASELAQAADYVASLFPEPLTEGRIRTNWRYNPSSELGGDSFGYHWIDDEHFAIYLLDVCGHGVGSALLAVSAINVLSGQTLPDTDFLVPASVMKSLNDAFPMDRNNGFFFTIWYGVLNVNTGELKFSGGGHPFPFLLTKSGEISEIENINLVVGCMSGVSYTSSSVMIPRGAKVFVFSDGAFEIERPDGTFWDEHGLMHYLSQKFPDGKTELDDLHSYLLDMRGKPILDDDYSILCVELQE